MKNETHGKLVPKSYIAYDTILLPKKIVMPRNDGGGLTYMYMQNNVNEFTFFEFQEGLSFDDDKRSSKNIKDKRYTNMLKSRSFPLSQKFEFYNISLSIPYMVKVIHARSGGSIPSDIFQLMASSDLMIYVGNCPFMTLTWDMLEDCGGNYYYKGIWRGREPSLVDNGVSIYAALRFEKSVEFDNEIFVKIGLEGVLYAEVR